MFLEQTVDFDNLQRYILAEPGRVNSDYATLNDIETVKISMDSRSSFLCLHRK
jgi:hypothetical protein